LDSHDILLPHHLECLSEVLEQDKNTGAAFGWHYWTSQEQKPISAQNSKITAGSFPFQDSPWGNSSFRPDGLILDNPQIIELLKQDALFLGNCLIRRECFDEFGPFSTDLKALGYLDFFAKIMLAGHGLKCVRRPNVLIQ
jgi:GT2 family glycosyltransferase